MNYAPMARIILRYVAGAGFMGSIAIGNQLAADPDIIFYGSMALAALVEAVYTWTKRIGGAT